MAQPLQVVLGGYAPPDSTHSVALDRIAEGLRADLGDGVTVSVTYNFLDTGRPVQEMLEEVEAGRMTACYFSTSYLAERVPELAVIDLPYVFASLEQAHVCLDGELGALLSERTRAATQLLPLGYWDNGFRHLTNRSRAVNNPADCRGLRVRLQPNRSHERFFRALGADPVTTDLRDGIARLLTGELDAQENPFANFVAYGLDAVHPYLTVTSHVFGARGFYASAAQLRAWPEEARQALGTAVRTAAVRQREEGARKEAQVRDALAAGGMCITELDADAMAGFRSVAGPVVESAAAELDPRLLALVKG